MQSIVLSEPWLAGAVSAQQTDEGIRPCRLNVDELPLYWSDRLIEHSWTGAGVRVRFSTDSSAVGLTVVPIDDVRVFDLVSEGVLLATAKLPAGEEDILFAALPPGRKTLEIWLSQRKPVTLRSLRVPEQSTAEPADDPRPRWTAYGSSITHCGEAHSPARTWPATAARRHGLNLTCLGFGGECHLDPIVGQLIADRPADLITLKVGINIQGACSLNARTLGPGLIGMVRTIRREQPTVPIGVISPILSPPRETQPNNVGLSLENVREQLAEAVRRLVDAGDEHLTYFDGRELFGRSEVDAGLLPDELHPNGDGYEAMGENAARVVIRRLLPSPS